MMLRLAGLALLLVALGWALWPRQHHKPRDPRCGGAEQFQVLREGKTCL